MPSLRRNMWISLSLGIVSLLSLAACALALADVSQGELDLTNEWMVIRLGLALVFIFNVFAVITLARMLRAKGE